MTEESACVMFFEMVNADGSLTLHVTLRAGEGEGEFEVLERFKAFAKSVDPAADLNFKVKDAPKYQGRSGGGSKPGKVEIEGNQFRVTALSRAESPKKQQSGSDSTNPPVYPNWSYIVAHGVQNGQPVTARCFVGDPGWVTNKNGLAPKVKDLWPGFFDAKVGEPLLIDPGFVAVVEKNEKFHNYDLTDIRPE